MVKKGLFITFEGPDGSGKTTQALLLISRLKKAGYAVLHTREPGGEPVAEKIRALLLAPQNRITPVAELLMYWAARSQHVHWVIKPALKQGMVVVCERFSDATMAYQGFGRGLDRTWISKMNKIAAAGLEPGITFLLDVAPRRGLRQVMKAKGRKDRFERENLGFHNKVRKGYLCIARQYPRRIKIISGNNTISNIQGKIAELVLLKLKYDRKRDHRA